MKNASVRNYGRPEGLRSGMVWGTLDDRHAAADPVVRRPVRWQQLCRWLPLPVSFNGTDSATIAPVVDASKPTELRLTVRAKTLHAGKLDIYRIRAPRVTGKSGCVQ